jgi:uncharacterized cupredoxin-like copper-binding protein
MKSALALAAALALNGYAELAFSHGGGQHGMKTHQTAAMKVTRTIDVDMDDRMLFTPREIRVMQGETIRFRVTNSGKAPHEMVLGTPAELRKHAEHMRKHPGMEHDAPSMAHVAPGKSATIVWQFTQAGEFQYGCLIPGHFEAGMIGRVRVLSN